MPLYLDGARLGYGLASPASDLTMEDIARISDRVLVMNNGKMEFLSTPENVFAQGNKLNEMGLKIPQITQIMNTLYEQGYNVSKGVLTIDEAVKQLLPILDNIDRAAATDKTNPDYIKGIEMIVKQFEGIASNLGIVEIAAEGDIFNPEMHRETPSLRQLRLLIEECSEEEAAAIIPVFQPVLTALRDQSAIKIK